MDCVAGALGKLWPYLASKKILYPKKHREGNVFSLTNCGGIWLTFWQHTGCDSFLAFKRSRIWLSGRLCHRKYTRPFPWSARSCASRGEILAWRKMFCWGSGQNDEWGGCDVVIWRSTWTLGKRPYQFHSVSMSLFPAPEMHTVVTGLDTAERSPLRSRCGMSACAWGKRALLGGLF